MAEVDEELVRECEPVADEIENSDKISTKGNDLTSALHIRRRPEFMQSTLRSQDLSTWPLMLPPHWPHFRLRVLM